MRPAGCLAKFQRHLDMLLAERGHFFPSLDVRVTSDKGSPRGALPTVVVVKVRPDGISHNPATVSAVGWEREGK